ncbi:hypothetical protein BAUCODRAFT_34136, partial [Baudoinia panamericana UAMH 10762]
MEAIAATAHTALQARVRLSTQSIQTIALEAPQDSEGAARITCYGSLASYIMSKISSYLCLTRNASPTSAC